MMLVLLAIIDCFRFLQGANILTMFTYPSSSHQLVFQSFLQSLSLRGHNVTAFTMLPMNDPELTNLTEISWESVTHSPNNKTSVQLYSPEHGFMNNVQSLYSVIDTAAEKQLKHETVQEMLKNEKVRFDLVMIHLIHPAFHALGHKFQSPVIAVAPMRVCRVSYDTIGNQNHPGLQPDNMMFFPPGKPSFWQKVHSVYYYIWRKVYHNNVFLPNADRISKQYIEANAPYIGKLEKDVSLLLINNNFVLHDVRPSVPAAIHVSRMHVKKTKPLAKDLQEFLDANDTVYVSFGSMITITSLRKDQVENLLEALQALPFQVLLKWDSDFVSEKYKNIIFRKWLPQKDILSHKNVKAFVTHGGQQSVEEAISENVPMIGIPIFSDQFSNTERIVKWGLGLRIDYLPFPLLKQRIIEVAMNKTYKENIEKIRRILLDEPMSAMDIVVWWSEYVIRHKGARSLRSASANISWNKFLLLDVVVGAAGVCMVSLLIMYWVFKVVVRCIVYSYTYKTNMK